MFYTESWYARCDGSAAFGGPMVGEVRTDVCPVLGKEIGILLKDFIGVCVRADALACCTQRACGYCHANNQIPTSPRWYITAL